MALKDCRCCRYEFVRLAPAVERDAAELDAAIDTAEKDPSHDPFDVEELRQRAATKRKEQEVLEKNRRDAVAKEKAEADARQKAELLAKQQSEAAPKKERSTPTKNFKVATPINDDDDEPFVLVFCVSVGTAQAT